MATLTAAELLDYRAQAAGCSTSDLSDDQIQAFYDKALTFGEDADTTQARTIVYMLRRLMGIFAVLTDLNGQIENERRSQLFDHVKDTLLPYWEGLAGLGGAGKLTAGMLNLNLDTEEDEATA